MRIEIPVCKRCCFCIPLRYGLMAWGILKLVTSTSALVLVYGVLYEVIQISKHPEEAYRVPTYNLVCTCLAGIVAATDEVLTITYLVGCYQKNVRLLRIYYFYSTFLVLLTLVFSILSAGMAAYYTYIYNGRHMLLPILMFEIMDTMILFANVVLQLYMIVLVRSEIVKLENDNQFRFVNHAADAACTLEVNKNEDQITEDKNQEENDLDEIRVYE